MEQAVRSVVVVALVSVLAAACGNGSSQAGGTDTGGAAQTGTAGSTSGDTPGRGAYYGSSGSTGATGSTGSTGVAADVQVSVGNYLFDPDPVQIASGDVVAVRNGNTRTPHTFTVVGEDVDLELAPQETETVKITLDPGTYQLICRFHESLGMTATLVVSR